jgi:hypothetical protein
MIKISITQGNKIKERILLTLNLSRILTVTYTCRDQIMIT